VSALRISNLIFSAAPAGVARGGLLGYVSFAVNDMLRLEGLTVRRTADDRLTLSFPKRMDRRGHEHFYIRPVDDRARRDVECQIFAALGIEKEVS